jgi:hypothetical protein
MKYFMLVCVDPSIEVPPDDPDAQSWIDLAGPRRLEGDRLRDTTDATAVRDRGRLVTDGIFAETKEQIAGYDVLECDSLDEAIELAAAHPVARYGALELRPFWEEPPSE